MSKEIERKTTITLFKMPSWEILEIAFIIMLAAKLFGYAPNLSWWIVTCPLWGPWAFSIAFLVISYTALFLCLGLIYIFGVAIDIGYAIYDVFKKIFARKERKDNDDDEYKLHG